MSIKTNSSSLWLDDDKKKISTKAFDKNRNQKTELPNHAYNIIKGILKSHGGKLENMLRYDFDLSILQSQVNHECSLYYYYDTDYTDHGDKRWHEMVNLKSDLKEIEELKQLPKGTTIYSIRHNDTKHKYYTYQFGYVNKKGEFIQISLWCLGWYQGVYKQSPYHDFVHSLGDKLKGDQDYFVKKEL